MGRTDMTDRYCGFLVTLQQDLRDDDAQATLDALRQIKGVIAVEPVVSDAYHFQMADTRVRSEIASTLMRALYPERYKDR